MSMRDDDYELWLANREVDKAYDREQGWQKLHDGLVGEIERLQSELAAALEEVEIQKAGRHKAAGAFEKMLCDRESELAAANERVEKQRVLLKTLSASWRITRPRWRPSREKP